MNFAEYQPLAMRTRNTTLDEQTQRQVAALGLCGEAGEIAEHVKKHIGHGRPLDIEYLKKELGDVLWYVALVCECYGCEVDCYIDPNGFDFTLFSGATIICIYATKCAEKTSLQIKVSIEDISDVYICVAGMANHLGISMSDIMQANIDKLKNRWPDGFDTTKIQAGGDRAMGVQS